MRTTEAGTATAAAGKKISNYGTKSSAGNGKQLFPILKWLPAYRKEFLGGDLMAGLIVAIMLVPQSMAYAMLAGLPPQIGLYASIVPLIVYAVFGSSRVLAVGPVAMVSLLTFSGIGALAKAGSNEFIALVLILALMTGVIQLLMGAMRLGFLVNYLSHPVLVGFTSAAAIVIGISQLKHILGIGAPRSENIFEVLWQTIESLPTANTATVAIGLTGIIGLIYFKYFIRKNLLALKVGEKSSDAIAKFGALAIVFLTTAAVWSFGLDQTAGVRVVGIIPTGLPSFAIPSITGGQVAALFPVALIISLVGFTESISIATTLAGKKRQKIDANQELIALGAANIGSSVFGGCPVTGGLSRSAVNYGAGAHTGLSSIVTAILVALTVLFLTPLFYFLPQAALSAIVIVAVAGLFDLRSFRHIWKYDKLDAAALLATFFGVLVFNIEIGIGLGIGTAILLYLYRTSKPHVAVVGRVGKTEHFRNVLRHEVETCPETYAVRIDESLYFANMRELERHLLAAAAEDPALKNILLICSAVNLIDSSALETLERVSEELNSAGLELYLAEIKGPVMDRLEDIGFVKSFGKEKIFLSTHLAFEHFGCRR